MLSARDAIGEVAVLPVDDWAVARTVHAAHLMEKVCHDRGQWQICVGREVLAASRVISREAIIIQAEFTARCWVNNPYVTAELLCDGVTLKVRPIRVPDEEVPFTVQWTFTLTEPRVASLLPVQ